MINFSYLNLSVAASIAVNVAMIVVGVLYKDPNLCQLTQIPLFLVIGGAVSLVLALSRSILGSVLQFGVLIYGSIVVFGEYRTWDYTDQSSDKFCNYTPFMLAFVTLILSWVLQPFIVCCCCVCSLLNLELE